MPPSESGGIRGERARRRARPDDRSAVEDNDVVGEPADLVPVVGDIENWYAELVADALEVRQDSFPELEVHGRQWFVQEQELWCGHQGTGEGDTLTLSPGERRDVTLDERRDFEHRCHSFENELLSTPATVENVPTDIHVREERHVLRDVSNVSLMAG